MMQNFSSFPKFYTEKTEQYTRDYTNIDHRHRNPHQRRQNPNPKVQSKHQRMNVFSNNFTYFEKCQELEKQVIKLQEANLILNNEIKNLYYSQLQSMKASNIQTSKRSFQLEKGAYSSSSGSSQKLQSIEPKSEIENPPRTTEYTKEWVTDLFQVFKQVQGSIPFVSFKLETKKSELDFALKYSKCKKVIGEILDCSINSLMRLINRNKTSLTSGKNNRSKSLDRLGNCDQNQRQNVDYTKMEISSSIVSIKNSRVLDQEVSLNRRVSNHSPLNDSFTILQATIRSRDQDAKISEFDMGSGVSGSFKNGESEVSGKDSNADSTFEVYG